MTSKDVIADNYLHVGKDIDEEALEALKIGFSRDEARRTAINFLNRRPLSKSEVRRKLIEKGQSEEASEETALWLEEVGLIDDCEYGRMVVRHYSAKGYGKRRISDELYRRGVPKEFWDEVFEEMPNQDSKIDEFLMSKLGGEMPDQREKKRVFDALVRRGYSYSEINSAFRRYEENREG